MARFIVKEIYEGTNEEVKALADQFKEALKDECRPEALAEARAFLELDPEETELQKQLREELEELRPLLNEETIARAEAIINSFDGSEETYEGLLNSILGLDDEDDCEEDEDEDEDDDCVDFGVIRIRLY